MEYKEMLTTISVIIATITFIISVRERLKKQKKDERHSWQRLVVFNLIEENNGITYKELKSNYLEKAQQLTSFTLPKKDIQDDALKEILLELQKDSLIYKTHEDTYEITIKANFDYVTKNLMDEMILENKVKPQIRMIIEKENGTHTVETIVRKLHEKGYPINFDIVENLINDMRGYSNILKDEKGILHFELPHGEEKFFNNDQ